jgi:hypothetical protein
MNIKQIIGLTRLHNIMIRINGIDYINDHMFHPLRSVLDKTPYRLGGLDWTLIRDNYGRPIKKILGSGIEYDINKETNQISNINVELDNFVNDLQTKGDLLSIKQLEKIKDKLDSEFEDVMKRLELMLLEELSEEEFSEENKKNVRFVRPPQSKEELQSLIGTQMNEDAKRGERMITNSTLATNNTFVPKPVESLPPDITVDEVNEQKTVQSAVQAGGSQGGSLMESLLKFSADAAHAIVLTGSAIEISRRLKKRHTKRKSSSKKQTRKFRRGL